MIIKADAPQDISGVRFAKSYALSQWQLGAFDFMDLDEWAASGYTSTNRSETRLLGDASNLFHFWCYGNDTVSACEVTESNELKFAITANTGGLLGGCWPRVNAGPALIIPLPSCYDIDVSVDLKVSSLGGYTSTDACMAQVGLIHFATDNALPSFDCRVALLSDGAQSSGDALEYVGLDGNFTTNGIDITPTNIQSTLAAGVATRTVEMIIRGSELSVWTGETGGAITKKGDRLNTYRRGSGNRDRCLVLALGQDKATPSEFMMNVLKVEFSGTRI